MLKLAWTLPDQLKWISRLSDSIDGQGFFYSRYDEPNFATKLGRRQLLKALFNCASQPEDVLVCERDQKEWGFNGGVTGEMASTWLLVFWLGTDPRTLLLPRF